VTKAEQEVVISKCADETHWTIYSTDPYWTRFFRALGKKMGARELHTTPGWHQVCPACKWVAVYDQETPPLEWDGEGPTQEPPAGHCCASGSDGV